MLRITSEGVLTRCRFSSLVHGNIKKLSTESQELPSHSDVVIIGGGATGCSILYQLSKRGISALLLERGKITCGTTWHSAGLFWRLKPSDVDIQLLEGTRRVLQNLEKESGDSVGFVNNGGIFISRTEERLKEYKRLNTLGHLFGVENHILDPTEAKKLCPPLNTSSFNGALYSPGDGSIDPNTYCSALLKIAKTNGGKVIENCPATSILLENLSFETRRIIGIETPQGVVKTNCIVNAAGDWGQNVAQMAKVDIPLVAMKHAYVVTESIPEFKGTPNIREHDAALYYKIQGDSVCLGGYESNPVIVKEVPKDFQFGLYDLDLSTFNLHLQKAAEITPSIAKVGIKKTVCGPEAFTPDNKPILGEDQRLPGLFHACGFNSGGIMLSGGCSEQVAAWIAQGRPDLPMFDYDIRRFTPSMRTNRAWITERTHETFMKIYAVSFPHDQPLSGRNFKIDVFHEVLVANGAVMHQSLGWEQPDYFIKDTTAPVRGYDWYGNYDHVRNPDKRYEKQLEGDCTFEFSKHHELIGEEALACRTNAALFDMSYFRKMYLTGPDAQRAADWLFTADTDKDLERVVYTCTLNKRGGVEGDASVIALNQGLGTLVGPILKGRGYYIVTNGAMGNQILAHMRREIARSSFRATVTDVTEKLGVLSVQGPKSGEILQSITEHPITDNTFPLGMSDIITIAGHTCRALRVSFVGELGYELHIPVASCIPVYNKLAEAGRSFGMRNAGYRALYSLSCEKGYHLWNYDLRSDDSPVEANLTKICRKDGPYLGKDQIDTQKQEGVKKTRVFFTLKDRIPLWGRETIWRDDAIVGLLRRGQFGYSLDSSIGIGYISHPKGSVVTEKFLKSGKYEVEVMGKRHSATLHLKSPFDPKNQRVLGIYENQFQEQSHFED